MVKGRKAFGYSQRGTLQHSKHVVSGADLTIILAARRDKLPPASKRGRQAPDRDEGRSAKTCV